MSYRSGVRSGGWKLAAKRSRILIRIFSDGRKHFTQRIIQLSYICYKLLEPYHHVTCDLVSINQHSHLSACPLGFLKFHIFCTYNGMLVPVQELVLICVSVTSQTMNCINWKLMWVCWTPWRFIELTFRVLTLLLFTVFDIPTSTFSWYNSFFYTYPVWKCIPGDLSVDTTVHVALSVYCFVTLFCLFFCKCICNLYYHPPRLALLTAG